MLVVDVDDNNICFITWKVMCSGSRNCGSDDPSINIALTCRAFTTAARVCIDNWSETLKVVARQLYFHFYTFDERLQFGVVGWLRMRLKMCGLLPTDFEDDNGFMRCLSKELTDVSKEMHGALTDPTYGALMKMSLPAKLHFLDIGYLFPVEGECGIDTIIKNPGFSAGATEVAGSFQMEYEYMSQEERSSAIYAMSCARDYLCASLQKEGEAPVSYALTYLDSVIKNVRAMKITRKRLRREDY